MERDIAGSDRTPRVLQLVPALQEGGVERCVVEMAHFLNARGLPNWIASGGGAMMAEVAGEGTRHIALKVGRKSPFAILANARAVARLAEREKINVIHAVSRAPAWVGWLACRLFLKGKCHFVTTVHGAHSHGNAFKRFYNSAMTRSEAVVASSRFIADHIRRVYDVPPEKIILAQRGTDTDRFDPALVSDDERRALRQEIAGIADDTPLLAMVSRVTALKGHAVLVEALAQVKDLSWRAIFVGTGNPSVVDDAKRRIAAHGLEDRITWTGSRRDVPAILAATDLAFSASIRPEACPLTTIEAQAMETPVIATDHGGARETVLKGESGWLVEPSNAEALAVAIREALADPARLAAMGRRGREHVLANFTRQTMLTREFSAYGRVLAGKPGS